LQRFKEKKAEIPGDYRMQGKTARGTAKRSKHMRPRTGAYACGHFA
jgi:hypothetical protein